MVSMHLFSLSATCVHLAMPRRLLLSSCLHVSSTRPEPLDLLSVLPLTSLLLYASSLLAPPTSPTSSSLLRTTHNPLTSLLLTTPLSLPALLYIFSSSLGAATKTYINPVVYTVFL